MRNFRYTRVKNNGRKLSLSEQSWRVNVESYVYSKIEKKVKSPASSLFICENQRFHSISDESSISEHGAYVISGSRQRMRK